MTPIAHIRSPYAEKFGIPRQSNIVADVEATIVFEPPFRNPDALRGIDEFDYIWLIWQFSENKDHPWSPTVRPPRLGGNRRMGVFATRSSFRPNALALSSVRLLSVQLSSPEGPLLRVGGCDLMDGTPIFDIKPYIPYCDAHPDARSGFAPAAPEAELKVQCDDRMLRKIDPSLHRPLFQILSADPRPHYKHDSDRIYGMRFAGRDVRFKVSDDTVTVVNIF